jgi:sulfane dehydrogenase subunit SoxC
MNSDRRQFLKRAALAGVALEGARSASAQTAGDTPDLTWGANPNPFWGAASEHIGGTVERSTPLADIYGIITPSELHFSINHENLTPNINAHKHRLLIHGMVDRPLIFTMEELKRLPSVSRVHYIACGGNSYLGLDSRKNPPKTVLESHGKTSCSEWTGVTLSTLLNAVGVQKGGNWLIAESADVKRHAMSIPLAKAMDDALLVYGQNGGPIRPEQGYPLRLLLPGWEGIRNVKWLRRLQVVDQPYFSRYEVGTYTNVMPDGVRLFLFDAAPGSVITYPSGQHHLPGPGLYNITGLAWSGGGAVHKVEISVDSGRTWKNAQLQEPIFRKAHTRFQMAWKWNGQETVIQSRCTDEKGDIQPTVAELTKIWNVTPDYWQTTTNNIHDFNAVQPWRVDREGNIHNAMFQA